MLSPSKNSQVLPQLCCRAALAVPGQEHALTEINTSQVASYTRRSVARTVREGSYYLPAAEAEAALGILCPALATLQFKKDVKIQLRATKTARGPGHMAYKEGWRELGLFSQAKRSLRAI